MVEEGRPEAQEKSPEILTHWEGEPVGVWQTLWGVPLVETWSSLGSTNDRARSLARWGVPAFTVVLAEEQTAGRGRGGRRWWSPSGSGIWMTVVLRPPRGDGRLLVPLLVGLAVCRGVERVAPAVRPRLKWPNDVLLGGRKVAGVLCEAVGKDALVAGVGVNVRQRSDDFPLEVRNKAVSLNVAAGGAVSRARLAGALLRELRILLTSPPVRLEGSLADEIASKDGLRGVPVEIDGRTRGRAGGFDSHGRLLVVEDGGEVHVVATGRVTLRSPATGVVGPADVPCKFTG